MIKITQKSRDNDNNLNFYKKYVSTLKAKGWPRYIKNSKAFFQIKDKLCKSFQIESVLCISFEIMKNMIGDGFSNRTRRYFSFIWDLPLSLFIYSLF